jgi:hypothetical protein
MSACPLQARRQRKPGRECSLRDRQSDSKHIQHAKGSSGKHCLALSGSVPIRREHRSAWPESGKCLTRSMQGLGEKWGVSPGHSPWRGGFRNRERGRRWTGRTDRAMDRECRIIANLKDSLRAGVYGGIAAPDHHMPSFRRRVSRRVNGLGILSCPAWVVWLQCRVAAPLREAMMVPTAGAMGNNLSRGQQSHSPWEVCGAPPLMHFHPRQRAPSRSPALDEKAKAASGQLAENSLPKSSRGLATSYSPVLQAQARSGMEKLPAAVRGQSCASAAPHSKSRDNCTPGNAGCTNLQAGGATAALGGTAGSANRTAGIAMCLRNVPPNSEGEAESDRSFERSVQRMEDGCAESSNTDGFRDLFQGLSYTLNVGLLSRPPVTFPPPAEAKGGRQ